VTKRILIWRILLLLLVLAPIVLPAQSKSQELYQQIERTNNPREKMRLSYELANLNLVRKPSIATYRANQAYNLAKSLGDSYYLRKSAVLLGKSFLNQADNLSASKWLKTGEDLAKLNKDLALLLEAATLQSGIEIRKNNYKKAYEINLAAINYVNKHKNSFQKTLTVTNSNATKPSVDTKALKANELKLTNENEDLKTQNEVLNDELLRLQYELAEKQLKIEAAKQDSQNAVGNLADSNTTSNLRDSIWDRLPSELTYDQSNREKLFSWISAGLGLLSLGLLAGLFFLYRKKENQQEQFNNSLLKKERLLNNYREELEENAQASQSAILGKGKGLLAKKVNPLSMLIVDLGTNLAFAGDKKTDEFVDFYATIMKDIKALLSQYPNIFYVKKIGTTLIFGSGVNEKSHDPDQLLKAAKDLQSYIQQNNGLSESVKIGIHSGPVFLSTIDYNTESLDILGHTFDQCAWIQSLAKDGQIVVSGVTKSLLNQQHHLELIREKKDWTGQLIELYELN